MNNPESTPSTNSHSVHPHTTSEPPKKVHFAKSEGILSSLFSRKALRGGIRHFLSGRPNHPHNQDLVNHQIPAVKKEPTFQGFEYDVDPVHMPEASQVRERQEVQTIAPVKKSGNSLGDSIINLGERMRMHTAEKVGRIIGEEHKKFMIPEEERRKALSAEREEHIQNKRDWPAGVFVEDNPNEGNKEHNIQTVPVGLQTPELVVQEPQSRGAIPSHAYRDHQTGSSLGIKKTLDTAALRSDTSVPVADIPVIRTQKTAHVPMQNTITGSDNGPYPDTENNTDAPFKNMKLHDDLFDDLPEPERQTISERLSNLKIREKLSHLKNRLFRKNNPENEIAFKAKEAREKLFKVWDKAHDWWEKQPKHQKLILSGALIGLSIAGTAGGSGLAVGVGMAGKAFVRGMGAYGLGTTAESIMRKKYLAKNGSEPLSHEDETKLMKIKLAVAFGALFVGTYLDTKEIFNHAGASIANAIDAIKDNLFVGDVSAVVSPEQVLPQTASITPSSVAQHIDTATNLSANGTEHFANVVPNRTLTSIILHSDGFSMFPTDDIAKLTSDGKQNFIQNLIKNLDPEQLKSVGISSGNPDLLYTKDKINLSKLADLAKHITVTVGGEEMTLLERALQIK